MSLAELVAKTRKAKPISFYKPGKIIKAKGTTYKLVKPYGKVNIGKFKPQLSPPEMLAKGIFEGKYLNDDTAEYPRQWYEGALKAGKLRPEGADVKINMFKIKSRLPLSEWQTYGWTPSSKKVTRRKQYDILSSSKNPDTKGWFQWYCRYYLGRRIPELDEVQQKRWRAFTRHAGAIKKNCRAHNLTCRPRQRQALLQWAYRPTI